MFGKKGEKRCWISPICGWVILRCRMSTNGRVFFGIQHPFLGNKQPMAGHGKDTAEQKWGWLGDGLWHCFAHITHPVFFCAIRIWNLSLPWGSPSMKCLIWNKLTWFYQKITWMMDLDSSWSLNDRGFPCLTKARTGPRHGLPKPCPLFGKIPHLAVNMKMWLE